MHNARRKSDPNEKEESKCNLRKLSQKKWTQSKSTTKFTETSSSSSSSCSAQMENRCFFSPPSNVLSCLIFAIFFYDRTNCVPSRMAKLRLLMPKRRRNQLLATRERWVSLDHNCMSTRILSWLVVACESFNRPTKAATQSLTFWLNLDGNNACKK